MASIVTKDSGVTNEIDKGNVVSVTERADELKTDSKALDPREKLSAYFTIAAAAFGLISDGCGSCFCP